MKKRRAKPKQRGVAEPARGDRLDFPAASLPDLKLSAHYGLHRQVYAQSEPLPPAPVVVPRVEVLAAKRQLAVSSGEASDGLVKLGELADRAEESRLIEQDMQEHRERRAHWQERFLCEQSVALPVHLRLQLLVGDPHHGTEPRQNAWIDETLEPNEVALSEDILLRCPFGVPAMFGTAHGQLYHGSYSGYARRRGSSRERRTDFRVGERRWNVTASEDARGGRPGEGRREPPALPLVMDAQEFGLSPEKLLPFLKREMRLLGDGRGRTNPDVPGRAGYRDLRLPRFCGQVNAFGFSSYRGFPWE